MHTARLWACVISATFLLQPALFVMAQKNEHVEIRLYLRSGPSMHADPADPDYIFWPLPILTCIDRKSFSNLYTNNWLKKYCTYTLYNIHITYTVSATI